VSVKLLRVAHSTYWDFTTEQVDSVKHIFFSGLLILVAAGCSTSGLDSYSSDISAGSDTKDGNLRLVSALPPPKNTNDGAEQPLAENDLLEVDVFEVDELDREVRIDPNGKISLSLIGSVQAGTKTISQLEAEIERAYGEKYLQNPEVSVFLKESAGQRVTVDGAIQKPGIYPVSSTSSLLQVVAQAGGFREIADTTKLYVFRDFGGENLVANYSVKDIRNGKKADPRIFGGDVIVSFSSGSKIAMRGLREALGVVGSASKLAVF